MAIAIEKRIDLTDCQGNPEPLVVEQLSIIHESSDGEIVQYYIRHDNKTQGDKNSTAIGVYDKNSETWSYHDYDQLVWGMPKHRICGNRIDRLGVKAFPGIGAIAFYKLAHRKITRIVAPVNRKKEENPPPELSAVVNADGTVTFTLVPPEKPKYECYRIVMENGIFQEDYITYELELTVPKPHVSGTYKCFAIGYGGEGQLYSKDSEAVSLELTGEMGAYEAPYHSKSEISGLTDISTLTFTGAVEAEYDGRSDVTVGIPENSTLTFTGHQNKSYNGSADVSVEIPGPAVLYGTEVPDAGSGINGSVYVQYEMVDGVPKVVEEWIKLEGTWVQKGGGDG